MPLQFTVPQFIDIEDKIFGPISVRQFSIILVGIGVVAMLYFVLNFTLFILAAPIACGVIALFAFFKINGQHFHLFILNVATTFRRPRVKLWHKHLDDDEIKEEKTKEKVGSVGGGPPKITPTNSRLRELSLIVDTGGAYGEESWQVSRDLR